VECEAVVVPPGPYRLPRAGRDGVVRRIDGVLTRALHHDGACAVVRAWPTRAGIRLRARAPTRAAALYALERMRFALGVDHDVRPFQRRFRRDRLVAAAIRTRPWLRPHRVAEPFEAFAWAITEQLIETERAWTIQRRLVWRYGRRSPCGTLLDAPAASRLARCAQAELQACDLSAGRSRALIMSSRDVAAGRVEFDDHDGAWRRLERIPGIGAWTLEKLAVHGQGRDDLLPAGDLAYLKLVGALADLGRRATVDEVRGFFAPYEPYAALAGLYALAGGFGRPALRPTPRRARYAEYLAARQRAGSADVPRRRRTRAGARS
jgi:3-methyladenine DNA glycosylase/8-oxoguanine DNA glycosylase